MSKPTLPGPHEGRFKDQIAIVTGGASGIGEATCRRLVAEGATARTPQDKAWMPRVFGIAGSIQQQIDKVNEVMAEIREEANNVSATVSSLSI